MSLGEFGDTGEIVLGNCPLGFLIADTTINNGRLCALKSGTANEMRWNRLVLCTNL